MTPSRRPDNIVVVDSLLDEIKGDVGRILGLVVVDG